jgi:trigger factor
MKIDVQTVTPVEKRLAIEIPWDTVRDELDQAYKGLAKRAKLPGFRVGHVPRRVLEQYFRGTVENEVVQRLLDDGIKKAIAEHALFPIDTPVVDSIEGIKVDTAFRFTAKIEVKPEVALPSWKGLPVTRQIRQIEETEVDTELQQLREKAVVVEAVTDRAEAQKGDLAVIDFFGYVNGETFKGGKGISYTVEIGSNRMIAGFEDQLVGMKIGEHKEFRLTFPANDGPEEVRGKDVDWQVDMKELKRKVLPELDDEFAKDMGDYESLAQLREKVKENLGVREKARSKRQIREKVLQKLVADNEVDVPGAMIERQLDFMMREVMRLIEGGKNPALREAIAKMRDENRVRARDQVAAMLLVESIAKAEDVSATEAELDGRLADIARQNRMTAKAVRQQLEREGRLDAIRYDIKQDKALDLVCDAAVVTDEIVTKEQLEAAEKEGLGLVEDEHEGHDHSGHDHDHGHSGHDHDHDHDHDHSGHSHG